jgi:hypothetical protein
VEHNSDPTTTGRMDRGQPNGNPTAIARWTGALFLAAFGLYGVGALLVEQVAGKGIPSEVLSSQSQLRAGALLIVANSIAVVAIGALMYRLAAVVGHPIRLAYLGARIFEATFLAFGAVVALVQISAAESAGIDLVTVLSDNADAAYQIAMIGLCAGSIPLFWALTNSHAMPRWLGLWGVLGYAVFGAGAVLEICGVSAGVALSIPGGIFEFVFAIYLLRRGALGQFTGNTD